MQQVKATGPRAAALKYDILTALLSLSLSNKSVDGRLAHRLALLITARFSWRTETFSVGTREIARLWSVTERTAKRELALMRARQWISVHRSPARGRVTEHRIDLATVLDATRQSWPAVGPDFVARMGQGPEETVPDQTVVPFRSSVNLPPTPDGSLWGAASVLIHADDPGLHAAWIDKLAAVSHDGNRLVLAAPSQFVASYVRTHLAGRLLAAVTCIDPSVTQVTIIAGN
ncbi:hypothetical protein [Yoonia sp.]|uniref:hypothetical protein n=1 Tax=Yoonia sp. TaxID=2212373 RepID=UPI00358E2B87